MKMPSVPKIRGAGHIPRPASPGKLPKPMKIHPAAQARIRLPEGNTGSSDPEPFLPGVGKL